MGRGGLLHPLDWVFSFVIDLSLYCYFVVLLLSTLGLLLLSTLHSFLASKLGSEGEAAEKRF